MSNEVYVSEKFQELNKTEIDLDNLSNNTYENDPLKESSETYVDIKCLSTVDKQGRTIYRFDEKSQTKQPLVIVIFNNSQKKLVSVNQQVLPLKSFLSIEEMHEYEDEINSSLKLKHNGIREIINEVRSVPLVNTGDVKAYSSENGKTYVFKNTTIPLVMMAISILTEKYITI
jgi:hypothetical protein